LAIISQKSAAALSQAGAEGSGPVFAHLLSSAALPFTDCGYFVPGGVLAGRLAGGAAPHGRTGIIL
jgi:hypothetical protein